MRTETGTFELRGNDMMMRELTDAEMNEVAGGVGTAQVVGTVQANAAGETITGTGSFTTAASNTSATAAINATYSGLAGTPTAALSAVALVTP